MRRGLVFPVLAVLWGGWSGAQLVLPDFPTNIEIHREFGGEPLITFDDENIARILDDFDGRILYGTPVHAVRPGPGGVAVHDAKGGMKQYDHVVIAAHGDEARAMLHRLRAEGTLIGSRSG